MPHHLVKWRQWSRGIFSSAAELASVLLLSTSGRARSPAAGVLGGPPFRRRIAAARQRLAAPLPFQL
jgi:hypothetical protein